MFFFYEDMEFWGKSIQMDISQFIFHFSIHQWKAYSSDSQSTETWDVLPKKNRPIFASKFYVLSQKKKKKKDCRTVLGNFLPFSIDLWTTFKNKFTFIVISLKLIAWHIPDYAQMHKQLVITFWVRSYLLSRVWLVTQKYNNMTKYLKTVGKLFFSDRCD